ncbi:hypothetical protein LTR56_019682 [Elasticomyces elasticus]|nr:hypothetical protein LTR56_019682 [Elasticomyces elasticus]KAK3633983.1 hypothetical protein LTR22_019850 [Elasticomyces elasticus]KAK4911122.1 hypothetical protein LTR49_020289 [Elasticomyces elasticus]KAK5750650.1 hypothetical protein LTS12_019271 [Elasticomyces elasticus]
MASTALTSFEERVIRSAFALTPNNSVATIIESGINLTYDRFSKHASHKHDQLGAVRPIVQALQNIIRTIAGLAAIPIPQQQQCQIVCGGPRYRITVYPVSGHPDQPYITTRRIYHDTNVAAAVHHPNELTQLDYITDGILTNLIAQATSTVERVVLGAVQEVLRMRETDADPMWRVLGRMQGLFEMLAARYGVIVELYELAGSDEHDGTSEGASRQAGEESQKAKESTESELEQAKEDEWHLRSG